MVTVWTEALVETVAIDRFNGHAVGAGFGKQALEAVRTLSHEQAPNTAVASTKRFLDRVAAVKKVCQRECRFEKIVAARRPGEYLMTALYRSHK
jgi:hypothetical protein